MSSAGESTALGPAAASGLPSHLDGLKAALTTFATLKGENLELWNHALVKGLLSEGGLVKHLENFDPEEMKNSENTGSSEVILIFRYIRSMLSCLLHAMNHAPTWTGRDDTGEQSQEDVSKYAVLVVANAFALSGACALVDPSPADLGKELKEFIPVFFVSSAATLRRMKTGEKTGNKYKASGRRPEEKHTLQLVPKTTPKVANTKGSINEKPKDQGKVQTSKDKQGIRLFGFDALYKNFLVVFVQNLGKVKFKALDTAFDPLFSTKDYKIPDSFQAVITLARELFVQLEILMGVNFKDFCKCSKTTMDMKEHNIVYSPTAINWAIDIGMVGDEHVPYLILAWKEMLEIVYGS